MLLALTFAAAANTGGFDIGPYGQLGAVGVVFAVLIAGARVVWKRETKRADKAEAQRDALEEQIRSTIVPQGLQVAQALSDARDLNVAMKAELDVYRRERRDDRP